MSEGKDIRRTVPRCFVQESLEEKVLFVADHLFLEFWEITSEVPRVAYELSTTDEARSLRGQLLLASPVLVDGCFDHAVILLSEHSIGDGAVGNILNHRTTTCVKDILPDKSFRSLHQLPVHHGGPVATDQLTFSSLSWDEAKGLIFEHRISAENASELVNLPNHIVTACIGHSAWAPGQLENELTQNTWITLPSSHEIFTLAHDLSLWRMLLKGASPYHHLLSQAPKNPLLN
jgi:putative transcriptional regulator